MHLQATLSRDDLAKLFSDLLPLTIHIAGSDHFVAFHDPKSVTLVPNDGLRLVCEAKISWPVLGINFPIFVNEVVVRVRPEIAERPDGAVLVFHLSLESADFALLPDAVDRSITDRINAELAKDPIDLSWGFARMLSVKVALPKAIQPKVDLDLDVATYKVRITDKGLGMDVSFRSGVSRTT